MNDSSKKRKVPAEKPTNRKDQSNKRPKVDHRAKQRDARTLSTQVSSKAFKNGELDVDKFVKAREYEIRALEEGMSRSKLSGNKRAFQQVPKDLRRRTASHNVKRVPKRLRVKAKREMLEDSTPTVTARRRKPTRHMRLRLETVKRLRALNSTKKGKAATKNSESRDATTVSGQETGLSGNVEIATKNTVRKPRVKKASLASPPVAKAKFRKRQVHKSWLPTHMFHTKRAHMSLPSQPLWRFAIPLSPTIKCYRPTHRSANERGAIAWDTSYFATIGLQGQQRSIDGLLRAMGVLDMGDDCRSRRWHKGTRVWEGYLREREDQHKLIAPATVIWAVETSDPKQQKARPTEEHTRKVLLRIHPSAFMQTWEELLRLSKVAKPQVKVEDLRFEIGSIEITGPGATETLLGALWPTKTHDASKASRTAEDVWNSLNGLNNPSMLPQNALLAFDIQDPRLHHPPRTIKPPTSSEHELDLLNVLAEWPVDETHEAAKIFGRQARLKASSSLPSQKAINRRRTLAVPGQYPESLVNDPSIPTLLYCVADSAKSPAKWVVLLPWRCVLPVWYSIMYYPLSSGGQPRFGGLQQIRQLAFEAGRPWFPADFPGTAAGMTWESSERKRREDEWRRKPKSKRTNWDAVDLGEGRRGEIGIGWACDWERLVLGAPTIRSDSNPSDTSPEGATAADQPRESSTSPKFIQVPRDDVKGPLPLNALAAVSIILTNRGVPETCARIYRLPTSPFHRKQWLTLRTSGGKQQNRARIGIPRIADDTPPHIAQQRLAQSLLAPIRPGQCDYPTCPGEEDLIGFVTSGNFNMGEGKGTGVGNILLSKIPSVLKGEAEIDRWCVVRNAGESIGRLAQWTFAS